MLPKLYAIRPSAWQLLGVMAILALTSAIGRSTEIIPSKTLLYAVQPAMAIGMASFALYLTRGLKDRVRHRSDKAFLIGSVLAVWFVLYFLSGLMTTYVHNSLVSSVRGIMINIWAFGVVAYAVEYSRHGIMLLVSRRNIVWFGMIVAAILSIQQMNFGLIASTHGMVDFIKLSISDFIPAIISSFLLTYLAITGGFAAMLVYRLGLVAITILPPIVPKYDWYLQGVSLIILAVSIYIALDRTRQDKQAERRHARRHHAPRAYDLMALILMVVLAMFMTGFFTYKPAAIVSNSMKPVFSRGSMVIVQKLNDPMDVKVGDIVQYRRTDKMITHRVVSIDAAADGSGKKVYTIKGDNNPSADPLVAQSQLVGIVRSQVPFIGYPTVWLQELSRGK
jgi:signal peptidase